METLKIVVAYQHGFCSFCVVLSSIFMRLKSILLYGVIDKKHKIVSAHQYNTLLALYYKALAGNRSESFL